MPIKKIRALFSLFILTGLLVATLAPAQAQENELSFVVMSDTRSETYIPATQGQAEQIQRFLRQRYPSSPDLFFDPQSGELQRMVISGGGNAAPTATFYRDEWPFRGGKVAVRKEGRFWTYRRVAGLLNDEMLRPGNGTAFALHTGDFILWGTQGQYLRQSPDWQDVHDDFSSKLPPPDPHSGLPGRVFPTQGNHKVWKDEEIKGLLTTLPCLHQVAALTNWLQEAKDHGLKQVFMTYHKPSFCISGHGPLSEGHNPHPYLKTFGADLEITVFNGHVTPPRCTCKTASAT